MGDETMTIRVGEGKRSGLQVVLVGLLLLTAGRPTLTWAAGSAAVAEVGELTVTSDPNVLLQGDFILNGTSASFSARHRGPEAITLAIAVNGIVVDADWQGGPTPLINIDGRGSVMMPTEKKVLQELVFRLERDWDPYSTTLPPERHFIFRLLMMLSEAPAGYKLGTFRIDLPRSSGVSTVFPGHGAPSSLPHPETSSAAECDPMDGQDGQAHYAGVCSGGRNLASHHDACNHEFDRFNHLIGCNSRAGCPGRCGAGCGSRGGAGSYTVDCADHDKCCADHGDCFNPFDSDCGDEYSEAVDDVLVAGRTCGRCTSSPEPDIPPCLSAFEDTATWVLSSGTNKQGSSPSHRFSYALSRSEERPEGQFFMDEWALIESTGGQRAVTQASTSAYIDIATRSADEPAFANADSVLVVQAGNHPQNSRFIPTPSLSPLVVDLGRGVAKGRRAEFWFRAEVAASRETDRMELLGAEAAALPSIVGAALRDNLSLNFVDGRRHRVVIFGLATISESGQLSVRQSLTFLPQCTCDEDECPWWDPLCTESPH